jgi:hypothetical protein
VRAAARLIARLAGERPTIILLTVMMRWLRAQAGSSP